MIPNRLFFFVPCAVFLCLTGNGKNALALSSPSPLNGYHFGATADTTRKVTTSNLRQSTRPKSYVPDGLTEEQYRQIRNDELAQQQSMKFGMWGPRFKQMDGDPDSNWFNLPSLWTGGFTNTVNNENVSFGDETSKGIGNRAVYFLRHYGLAYSMLLVSSQLLAMASSQSAKQFLSSKWIGLRMLISFVALKPLNVVASLAGRRRIGWLNQLNKNGTTKLAGVMAVLMTFLAIAMR
mmetsp:Transcript_21991/g.46028  ORF Transcript_21991/g.46028 Transcript_21991/m.46028 type:complete len:236 (-) Transcript_21991:164-871(-)